MKPTFWIRQLPKIPGLYLIKFEGVEGFKFGRMSTPERILSYCRPWIFPIVKIYTWQFEYETPDDYIARDLNPDMFGEHECSELMKPLEKSVFSAIPIENRNVEFIRNTSIKEICTIVENLTGDLYGRRTDIYESKNS